MPRFVLLCLFAAGCGSNPIDTLREQQAGSTKTLPSNQNSSRVEPGNFFPDEEEDSKIVRTTLRKLFLEEPWEDPAEIRARWEGKLAEIEIHPLELIEVRRLSSKGSAIIDVTQEFNYSARCDVHADENVLKQLNGKSHFLIRGRPSSMKMTTLRPGGPSLKMIFMLFCEVELLDR